MASTRVPLPRHLRLPVASARGLALSAGRTTTPLARSSKVLTKTSSTAGARLFSATALRCQPPVKNPTKDHSLAPLDELQTFIPRHIGPDSTDAQAMLKALTPEVKSMDEFISQVVPADILSERASFMPDGDKPVLESDVAARARNLKSQEKYTAPFIGAGYYPTYTPQVIQTNVLENPAWYTSYTPYQPEISQGRLESLLNFQTMVSDLTGLPISNSSLLDEGTAAAEAMTLSMNALPSSRLRRSDKTYVVSHLVHPQTLSVLRGRASGFNIKIEIMDIQAADAHQKIEALGDDLVGVMVQYPDTRGHVNDFKALADVVHSKKALLSVATDLLALTLLSPPGDWGADIAFGTAQRFGIPLGFGGPHAAFFSVGDAHKRKIPGRIVGVSKDRTGKNAVRLALQTREQHIRREKATSNVCTAQALLANMSALFAIYHGPQGLKEIASKVVSRARGVQEMAKHFGLEVEQPSNSPNGQVLFDTVIIKPGEETAKTIVEKGEQLGLHFRELGNGELGISVGEATDLEAFQRLASTFAAVAGQDVNAAKGLATEVYNRDATGVYDSIPETFQRRSDYLTHPVFNTHRSETEILRYIHHLVSKDLSLIHSMIPLGSCTMKLNGATEMSLISKDTFAAPHPYTNLKHVPTYLEFIKELEDQLSGITSMDATTLQPNSGAQGEFAGLRVIRRFHEQQPGAKRDICLIPKSAHGTNPASAAMAGMRVVPIECDSKTGNLDIEDLKAKCKKHEKELGAIMVTYPSTYGVFEPNIKQVCDLVHEHGGQVYMDGANMNAQIGLCSPGEIGADVCHLNLHKTFCIPHGGGGPGVGPICVKSHLAPYLPPLHPSGEEPMISSAPYGSAGILPIPWAYNSLMGNKGLRMASKMAILNANYILARLKPHYEILYTNEAGRCAHEFILDARPFAESAGIEVIDIAKRLQDYGFHAPTMSWPVTNTLMIEPTESESKEELDRFIDALISIRQEIRDVEEGKQPRQNNVLKNSPHPQADVILGDNGEWNRPYTREKAAYPLPYLREKKFWPSVARVDDAYGDTNLFCTCPPVVDTTGEA